MPLSKRLPCFPVRQNPEKAVDGGDARRGMGWTGTG